MPQTLTHAFISKQLLPKRYFDSTPGLHLYVKPSGAKYWVVRRTINGKRRDKCIGTPAQLSLAEARTKALEIRQMIHKGQNPFVEARDAKESIQPKFQFFAKAYIESNKAQWRSLKHIDQWHNTLRDYAYPVIGHLSLDDIKTDHILRILEPIWTEKPETASRIRGRLERVLSAATTRGFRTGMNPAIWRGHLENILPKPNKIKRVVHHAAIPYAEVADFVSTLREKDCVSALALEFLLLTAARTSEVRFARHLEIQDDVWIIPAEKMKAGSEHRVPLCARAIEIIEIAESIYGKSEYLFHRLGRPLSNVAMSKLLKGIAPGFTVHGLRSSFRDWVAEETDHSRELAEMALSHRIKNQVEAAYRRGDLLAKRRTLINDWSEYCNG